MENWGGGCQNETRGNWGGGGSEAEDSTTKLGTTGAGEGPRRRTTTELGTTGTREGVTTKLETTGAEGGPRRRTPQRNLGRLVRGMVRGRGVHNETRDDWYGGGCHNETRDDRCEGVRDGVTTKLGTTRVGGAPGRPHHGETRRKDTERG